MLRPFATSITLAALLLALMAYSYLSHNIVAANNDQAGMTPRRPYSQNTNWKRYENKIMGYRFDYPDSWAVRTNPWATERQVTVSSCPSNARDCEGMSFDLQVVPHYNPMETLPPDWTKTDVNVGGIAAEKVTGSDPWFVETYFKRRDEWYSITLHAGGQNKHQAERIFDRIISSFTFIAPQPLPAPPEYHQLKGDEVWSLTYQDWIRDSLKCTDGGRGNVGIRYVFSMSTQGDTKGHTSAGDIDAPYAMVIETLRRNGWQQCKHIGETELADTQGTSEVFIKNNRIIGVYRHYSMGVGNSLGVVIQYPRTRHTR